MAQSLVQCAVVVMETVRHGLQVDARSVDVARRMAREVRVIKTERVFVFGSNLAGRHGKGAALFARHRRGAKLGVGKGRTGNAYAIPTKDRKLNPLPLYEIAQHVAEFIRYARQHPEEEFLVTRIGCGHAGYLDRDIAPMFSDAPKNCLLPNGWETKGPKP